MWHEDWSNDAENSVYITRITVHLNPNNISQFYSFYCIFDQINFFKNITDLTLFEQQCINIVKNNQFKISTHLLSLKNIL